MSRRSPSPSASTASSSLLVTLAAALVVAAAVMSFQIQPAEASAAVQEAVLQDPRFVTCMEETSGPSDPNFMTVFAKCYSFAGRPRFGKRNWRYNPQRYDLDNYLN